MTLTTDVPASDAPVASDTTTALMIVPTYNEAGNIERLLDELFALPTQAETGWKLHVLVRDDRSPDGTGDIVRALAAGRHRGRLILSTGTKGGLGKALVASFEEALVRRYPVVLTMDADFSHSPEDVVPLLAAITAGADVAVGSRYIEGGLIPGNWPLGYIVRTRVATSVARLLGGVSSDLRELTTNFRAMRRDVLEAIDFGAIEAKGYGMQIFLANAFTSGAWTVREVPISFRSRASGESKATVRDIVEFLTIAARLNTDSPVKQLLRFVLVGASGTLVNLASFWLMVQLTQLPTVALSAIAIQLSILWNFGWHSRWTFRAYRTATLGRRTLTRRLLELATYEGITAFTQTVTFVAFLVLFLGLGVHYLFAQLLGIGVAFVVNYWLSSTYVWSQKRRLRAV